MSEFAGWIDGGATGAEALGKAFNKLFTPGTAMVLNPTYHQVTERGAGQNMSVDIAPGAGITDLADYSIPVWSNAIVNKTVTAADPTNPRKDIVVRYVSLLSFGPTNNQSALKFIIVAGTPAGSPSDPSDATIQAAVGAGNPWEKLARITLPANAITVVNAYITDLRAPIAFAGPLWGGSSNTNGHTVPNVADDTLQLLNAAQSPTNKTFSGSTNKMTTGGANSVLRDANAVQVDLEQQRTEHEFNYVASGCVWSGDSYGSTLNGSMTSGVVYIAGRRLTVATITAHAFTASKDTYVDFKDAGNGTATVVYTEATNNAASPSTLSDASTFTDAANIRNAIIVTGANILNVGSVNQGQETKVLPIASSIAYTVTDSLGNLICPRDPNRKILGYRQITTGLSTASASSVQATGLSVPVIVPVGRKIRITFWCRDLSNSAISNTGVSIWDGIVGSGTQLAETFTYIAIATGLEPATLQAVTTPSTSSKTYNIGVVQSGGGTASIAASSVAPAFIQVELE